MHCSQKTKQTEMEAAIKLLMVTQIYQRSPSEKLMPRSTNDILHRAPMLLHSLTGMPSATSFATVTGGLSHTLSLQDPSSDADIRRTRIQLSRLQRCAMTAGLEQPQNP